MISRDKSDHGGSLRGRRICIVGGGIGGLTAALAFSHFGAKNIDVFEQADAFKEVGAGIQITPNGGRVLEALDLTNDLSARSIASQAVVPTDAMTGRAITQFDLTRYQNPPYRFMHRADLIGLLADACRARGIGLNLGTKTAAQDLDADLIVGADGVHSEMRPLLNGPESPFFTRQVAWRAVVKAADVDPVARIWMAPRRHVVTYPLPDGRLNIVAVQERQQWAAEGWNHADDAGNLRHAFREMSGRLTGILGQVEDVNLWGLFRHPVAKVWAKDNLCILGDAAHPTLPFLAQGANLAIEDAFLLARSLSEAAGIEEGLTRYEALRKPRVSRAIAAANANARKYHLSGIARGTAHIGLKTIGFAAPNAFLNRMSWLYDHDVTG